MKKIVFAATAALFALGATAAMAQTTTAPAVTPAAPKVVAPLAKPPAAPATTTAPGTTAAAKKTVGVATTEIGKKCSADADAAGLKGKPRVAFRAKCKKEATKASAVKKN